MNDAAGDALSRRGRPPERPRVMSVEASAAFERKRRALKDDAPDAAAAAAPTGRDERLMRNACLRLAMTAGLPYRRLRVDLVAQMMRSSVETLFSSVRAAPTCSACMHWSGADPRIRVFGSGGVSGNRMYVRRLLYRLFHSDVMIDGPAGDLRAKIGGVLTQLCPRANGTCINPEHMTVVPRTLHWRLRPRESPDRPYCCGSGSAPAAPAPATKRRKLTVAERRERAANMWRRYHDIERELVEDPIEYDREDSTVIILEERLVPEEDEIEAQFDLANSTFTYPALMGVDATAVEYERRLQLAHEAQQARVAELEQQYAGLIDDVQWIVPVPEGRIKKRQRPL